MKPTISRLHGVATGVAVAILASGSVSADDKQVKRTDLLQVPLGVAEGMEVVSYLVEGPGGGPPVPKHRHHGDEFLYVVEGAVTVMPEGAEPVTVRQGEMYHLPFGIAHSAKNASATDPARTLVVHVKKAGKPVSVPVE